MYGAVMNKLFARFSNVEGMNARSNVLVSLLWLFFITLAATVSYGIWGSNEILLYFFVGALSIELLSIIIAYFIFAFTNPDCLRSETFTLSKLAIEKGQVGDGIVGIEHQQPEQAQKPVIIEVKNG